MKRRDFVKAGICLGCAGALGTIIPVCKKEGITSLSDIRTFLAERKFLYKSVEELPKKIKLDLCNLCQLNCAACWMRQLEDVIATKYGGFGYVPFATFKKFIDENPFIDEIEVSHCGEIFLNPELEDIVRYAYEKNIKLTALIGTNMNKLSEKMAEALVKYQFKALSVSIDAATPETYPIYRRNGNFNDVIHNIKTINKYKKKYNSRFPEMVYNFILFGHNVHEIEKAKALAKELDMMIMFLENYDKNYSPLRPEDEEWILKATGMETTNSDQERHIREYQNGKYMFGFCTDLYQNPQINWNGELFGCSLAYGKSYNINVFEEGLFNALNNQQVLYAKLMLSDYSVEPTEEMPCSECGMYPVLKSKKVEIKDPKSILKII